MKFREEHNTFGDVEKQKNNFIFRTDLGGRYYAFCWILDSEIPESALDETIHIVQSTIKRKVLLS